MAGAKAAEESPSTAEAEASPEETAADVADVLAHCAPPSGLPLPMPMPRQTSDDTDPYGLQDECSCEEGATPSPTDEAGGGGGRLRRRRRSGSKDAGAAGHREDPSSELDEGGPVNGQSSSYYYESYDESCSETMHMPAPFLRNGRRTRQQLNQRVKGLVQELRRRQEVFQRRQRNLAHTVNEGLRHQWLAQQERLVRRSRQMTAKLQSGRSRAWRHKWVFALVQADFAASAFWLGRSPERYHIYYTVQILFIMACKVLDYRVKAQHYFLLDFCFFANFCILMWLWCMPTSGLLFNAAEGVVGLLAISVVVFRNSCVPHDFVRISNAYVHYPGVLCMLSVKMQCEGDLCVGMQTGYSHRWYVRFWHAWAIYLTWAVVYASVIFFFARQRIDRKQRDTLYKYFALTLGYKEKLPKWLKPYSQVVFMLGHQSLFLLGVWWLFLPLACQAFVAGLSLLAFFHNGGRFYVDHFWKAYERNTETYVDAAITAMSQGTDGSAGKAPDNTTELLASTTAAAEEEAE